MVLRRRGDIRRLHLDAEAEHAVPLPTRCQRTMGCQIHQADHGTRGDDVLCHHDDPVLLVPALP